MSLLYTHALLSAGPVSKQTKGGLCWRSRVRRISGALGPDSLPSLKQLKNNTWSCLWASMCTYPHVHTCQNMCAYMHTNTYTHKRVTHTHMYIWCVYVYMYINMCIYGKVSSLHHDVQISFCFLTSWETSVLLVTGLSQGHGKEWRDLDVYLITSHGSLGKTLLTIKSSCARECIAETLPSLAVSLDLLRLS